MLEMMDPCKRTCGCRCLARRAMSTARHDLLGNLCNQRAVWANLRRAGPAHDGKAGMRHCSHRRPMQAFLHSACAAQDMSPAFRQGRSVRACDRGALRPDLRLPGPVREQRILGRQQRLVQVVDPDLPAQGSVSHAGIAAARVLESKKHLTKQVLQYATNLPPVSQPESLHGRMG